MNSWTETSKRHLSDQDFSFASSKHTHSCHQMEYQIHHESIVSCAMALQAPLVLLKEGLQRPDHSGSHRWHGSHWSVSRCKNRLAFCSLWTLTTYVRVSQDCWQEPVIIFGWLQPATKFCKFHIYISRHWTFSCFDGRSEVNMLYMFPSNRSVLIAMPEA